MTHLIARLVLAMLILPPIICVFTTVLIWRDTPVERLERFAAAGTDTVVCPICAYNLTGLHKCRCPECGSPFTLDQLLAAQSRRDEHALLDS